MSDLRKFTLGEVTTNYDSRRIPVRAADRQPGPYPYYGASGVVDYVHDFLFDGEYLLLAEDGENLRTRKTPAAFMATGRFWINNHVHILQGNHQASTRYLSYILGLTDISGYLSGSTQPKLTQAAMNRIEVLLPSRPIQDAIVELLGALDYKIAANDSVAASSRSLLRALFKTAIKSAHRRVPLRELIDLRYGKALKEGARTPGPVPVYGSNGISGWHQNALADGPGVIVGRKGANAGSVSWSQGPFWVIDTAFYAEPISNDISHEFILFLLDNIGLRGLVGDSAIPGLNREIALSCQIVLPDVDAVTEFTSHARALLPLEFHAAIESRTLGELRDTLLPKLMSGEIRVRDAEKVVEEAT